MMDKEGTNNHKVSLPIYASQPRWSPDGKRIIFVSYQDLYHGDTKIWEVNLETLKLKKLTHRPWLQYDPYYQPDGSSIIFTDGPELYAQDIYQLDLKKGDSLQRTDNRPYDFDMQAVYSADGEKIVFSSNQDGNYDIWIMDKFGQDRVNLTRNPGYDIMPQISRDGKKIYFLSDRSKTLQVWRMDIDGANLAQITNTQADIQDLALYTTFIPHSGP
jgi:TolB protein